MDEKRKSKRLDLSVRIELSRIDQKEVTTIKYATVEVTDISKTGLAFRCSQKMETDEFYDARIQIWTKEVIDVVLKIVRVQEEEGGYKYGCIFIGMTDTDALKIQIYQMFNEDGK